MVTVLQRCRISWAEGRAGTLGTPAAGSGSARDEPSSVAEDSTKPESFLLLALGCGDSLLSAAGPGELRAGSTSGRDRDRSGFQASRACPSPVLAELTEELSESSSGVELALGRDRDLLLWELPSGPGCSRG